MMQTRKSETRLAGRGSGIGGWRYQISLKPILAGHIGRNGQAKLKQKMLKYEIRLRLGIPSN